ncbi:TetR/AcrR family transcriptional regulator (plasmid) [Prescottella equi]|uniref:TetR/AcrR family transcriptional regulator n=1 Tax=Rhodococcus hoagii TaxID=43767 RepID=UPI002578AC8A|nr:TetR/AcrR family transcriptional regulator [Prescottella equi]WJJ14450.1 TetR/AcrR family transcriptional regulator [Prescottella equi]
MTTTAATFQVAPRPLARVPRFSTRQEQILDGLQRSILAEGFRSLRLTNVTKELGTSYATLYQIAPSKDELVALVIERWYQRAIDAAVQRLHEAHDPVARMQVWTDFGVEGVGRTSRVFWLDVNAHNAIRGLVATYSHYYVEVLRDILDHGIELGTFRPVNTELLAAVWETAATKLADSDLQRDEPRDLRQLSADWVDLILNGLLRI